MSSVYPLPTYRLKERIYENSDKSIVIYRTRKKQTIKYIAVKIYSKSRQPFYDHEYSFLKNINHPSIINVTGAAEDKNYFYMEMEYCPSGDLSHCLWPNKGANYFEKIIKTVSVQLLLGLKTLHQNGIIHCNLKPSNIIIDEFGNVKICDFKKALNTNTMTMQEIKKNKTAMTPCYTAPELFNENGIYTFKTDLWALGCIMYEMAIGQVPFFEERVNKLIMKILKEEINFNKKQFNQYSMEFMDVLRKLLEKDPDKRPCWGEIENYPFWGLNYNSNNIYVPQSARRRQNSNPDNSHFSLNNSELNNNTINENSIRQIKRHESSSSSSNLHTNSNLNKNNEVKQFDINYEGEYDNNGDNNDKEVNINMDNNNTNNFHNDEENNNYTNSKFKNLLNRNNSNDLSMSLLKINKLGDKKEKTEVTDILNDMAISLAKPDESPKVINIMMHASDKNIKPIIGNKIIEPDQKPITYDEKMIPFKPIYKIDKIKELIVSSDNTVELEKYLKQIVLVFIDFEEKKKYDELLNLLNYFETIILSKEISNSIINTVFIQKFIEFLDINNDQIRIRSCSIIASLIRYATTMNKSLDEYNLAESLISFISDNNILLNRIAIATLGEYLFFVSTQVEELDQTKLGLKSTWAISQESITALLFALNHIDEKVKFYSLKTIENICSLTTIAKTYFASNDDFINKIIEIINSDCENPEIRTSAFNTVSHIIRHEPSLIKCFIDKMDSLNYVIEKESQRNQQYIINCLLFGIAQDNKYISYINVDELIPVLINLLKNSNNVIKPKVILLLSLIFNQVELITKYGEKIFELMMKLRKEKHQFYYYVKLFESFMINYCININKRYISICETQTSNNNPEIISILKCFNIIAPYHKISYIIYNKEFLLCTFNLILNSDLKSEQIFYAFDSYKAFSENPFSVEENSDLIINKIFTKLLSLTNKLNDEYRRFPLNICANILTVLLEDEKLYSSTTIEGGKTNQINSLIITILPNIYSLLKNEDTVTDSLAFLSLIIERNSAFIKFYRNAGIIDYIFVLMKDPNLYSNLNLIKILIKLIESSDTGFKDILELDLIDKVNYMISKDNLEEITVYTEYVIEMLFDLLFKINETKKKFSANYDKENFKKNFTDKIEKIAVNFKLCIKLLGCEHENIQELSCVNLIFMLQFFPNGFNKYINGNVKFTIEDIPDLLKGLDSSCKKIHKKMIKIFKWIIEYQDDAKEILKNYVSYIQICVEKIKNSATEQDTMDTARKFLENDLVKIING